ncbi:class A beta-lactamase-related serine hydrolase [Tissierella sp. MSJ-40]|uniref:Class A beta-lactamase-related serine hydrolase n=1 Tax=Tissierella simiarum TaxID=2841534 RepID=A0ABS6E9J1_9FIRM|nr:serine hydrolase [Tissierella simiarum]MBU5439429.1 class A beta-lactamase-related serine hydrolase [Tissierella simiarum]
MLIQGIEDRIRNLKGNIGIYYHDINTDKYFSTGNTDIFLAAGIIKIPILIEAFHQIDKGIISRNDIVKIKNEDKIPSCGALSYLHNGIEVTIEDMCNLMIIISDNTATNILIKLLGMDNINKRMQELDYKNTVINRLLFDEAAIKQKYENYYSLREVADMMYKIYKRQLISEKASMEMEKIMIEQQRNQIIPYYFDETIKVAHKTGEDNNIIHDIGIVLSDNPFILCMGANNVDVRKAESAMRDIALICYNSSNQNTDNHFKSSI